MLLVVLEMTEKQEQFSGRVRTLRQPEMHPTELPNAISSTPSVLPLQLEGRAGLFWSLPLRKRKPSTSRRVLSGGRTSRLSSALPMAPSTAKASTFSGAFRHGWRRSGRCPTVELWALPTCDCRWPSCALQFTVYVGPGGSFSPSPTTQEQPSPYFPRLSSFCSHFLLVVLSSLLSMPGLQTF